MSRKASAQQQLELGAALLEIPPTNGDSSPRRHTKKSKGSAATAVATSAAVARSPSSAQLLATPGALLTRSHLRQLGLERRAIDAVFRALPVVSLPGYSRPMIRADHYLALVEQHTYSDDRVRPCDA
jgi:hypothetical protein